MGSTTICTLSKERLNFYLKDSKRKRFLKNIDFHCPDLMRGFTWISERYISYNIASIRIHNREGKAQTICKCKL